MGGSSKSSASTVTTTNTSDERIAATDTAVVLKDVNGLTLTDPGAFDLAGQALTSNERLAVKFLDGVSALYDQTMSAGELALDKIFDGVQKANEKTTVDTTGAQKMAPWLMAGVAVVALTSVMKGR